MSNINSYSSHSLGHMKITRTLQVRNDSTNIKPEVLFHKNKLDAKIYLLMEAASGRLSFLRP